MLLNEMARQRASIYRWFSQLLFQELSDQALTHLQQQEHQALLAALKSLPQLTLPVRQLQDRLRSALKREERQLELAADFASLFLLPPPAGVSPYAGHYPHTTSAEERKTMQQWLISHELAPQNNEALDHLAIQLALMAALIEKGADVPEAAQQQYHFLQRHLLSWLPLFSARCQQQDNFGFYAAAVAVLLGFVQQDAEYLQI